MKLLGVIINPIAGMGGRVGLKGTDGAEIVRKALELGARPESPHRALQALKAISFLKDRIQIITCAGDMGENECRQAGFVNIKVIGPGSCQNTTAEDTETAARKMVGEKVDLLMFAGGDGTARNIYNAIRHKIPVIGIPTGVKIHSAVYAITPKSAGHVAAMFLQGRFVKNKVSEVMDIDEDAFRKGFVSAKLYGTLRVPEENLYMQSAKSGGFSEQEALHGIALSVIESMGDPQCFYIIGPGTTTFLIMKKLGLKPTLLGVDVICNKQLVANDVNEKRLIALIRDKKAKIVVTVIGGQGHVFGRGNQQISPEVIRSVGRDNILVVATREKLIALKGKPLLVDTGNQSLNRELGGYVKVLTGYNDFMVYKVGHWPVERG
jgi:predicted polyphosphate/ATP-dependent NAD kinase